MQVARILLVALLAYIILVALGYTPLGIHMVAGYSMWPTLKPGDLVVSLCTCIDEPKIDDIVVYRSGPKQIIHRVINIDGNIVFTKGDYSPVPDPPIPLDEVDYVAIARIPLYIWPPLLALPLAFYCRCPWPVVGAFYIALLALLLIDMGVEQTLFYSN